MVAKSPCAVGIEVADGDYACTDVVHRYRADKLGVSVGQRESRAADDDIIDVGSLELFWAASLANLNCRRMFCPT